MNAAGHPTVARIHSFGAGGDGAAAYFDTADVIVSSPVDGIHWEASVHAKLGRAVAELEGRLSAEQTRSRTFEAAVQAAEAATARLTQALTCGFEVCR